LNGASSPKHLRNIYDARELHKEATCAKFAQVQTEGDRQGTSDIEFYKWGIHLNTPGFFQEIFVSKSPIRYRTNLNCLLQ
jgi:hypothetical protein